MNVRNNLQKLPASAAHRLGANSRALCSSNVALVGKTGPPLAADRQDDNGLPGKRPVWRAKTEQEQARTAIRNCKHERAER